jgi:hypothetical protein
VSEPAPIDVPRQRRRLMVMIAVDAACVLVAMAALVGDLAFHISALIWLFAAAMVAGFAAQAWLIVGIRKD